MLRWFTKNKKAVKPVIDTANPHYRGEKVGNDASARPWENYGDQFAPHTKRSSTTSSTFDPTLQPPDVPSQAQSGLFNSGKPSVD